MSQHDFEIANDQAGAVRADLNGALQALVTKSSGTTAPATTYPNQFWYKTDTNMLYMRSEADDAWISVAYLDQSANAFRLLEYTLVTDAAGAERGRIQQQGGAIWNAGTGTTETLVSPAKIKGAIQTLAPATDVLGTLAAQGAGNIGMDALLIYLPNGTIPPGTDVPGSNLQWSGSGNVYAPGSVGFGTWRCKGSVLANEFLENRVTLWTRIA